LVHRSGGRRSIVRLAGPCGDNPARPLDVAFLPVGALRGEPTGVDMALVAKRKLTETWREAIARRGREFGREQDCLEPFDALVAAGMRDLEAAYQVLKQHGFLWPVDEPQDPSVDGGFDSERATVAA
jgi:hypothetical protein